MSRRHLRLCLALALAGLVPAISAQASVSGDLSAQQSRLVALLPGEYDNHEQILRQSGGGWETLTETPNYRIHTIIKALDPAKTGEPQFDVLTYKGLDPKAVLRHEIITLVKDEALGSVRARRTDAVTGALPKGCDLAVEFLGQQFHSRELGKCPAVNAAFVLGDRFFWLRSASPTDDAHAVWFQQTRAKLFMCEVDTVAGGLTQAPTIPTRIAKVYLRDQGGEADIPWPDGRTITLTIQNRAFAAPSDYEYPMFRVHEKGNRVPIAYGYTTDGSSRFGLNLGWFYTRCYEEGHYPGGAGG